MKRILFVSKCNPFERGGGAQATLAYLQAIIDLYGRDNLDVMLPAEVVIPKDYNDIKFILIRKRSFFKKLIEFPLGYLTRMAKPLINYLNKHSKDYDACILNSGAAYGFVVKYLRKYHIKPIVIHHNYEVEYSMDNKTTESFYGFFPYYLKLEERTSYKLSDYNLFLTSQDCETFERVYGCTIGQNFVIGTFEPNNSYKGIISLDKKYTFSVSGSLCDYQTLCGIKDFYSNYFQIAKKIVTDLNILLTGRNPLQEIINIVNENPEFSIMPNPENIFSVVSRGAIYLCPTNIGGGLKLRAMDGLKCGMPILVHKISSRGYDYYFDKPYFQIYEDEPTFRQGLMKLLFFVNNTPNYGEMILEDFNSYFGYSQGVKRMEDILMQ